MGTYAMKKILIVIPVINLWEKYTRPLLENIKNDLIPNTKHELSVALMDNGSTDETKGLRVPIEEYPFIEMVFRSDENRGLSPVWNIACKRAFSTERDFVFIINNDVLFNKDAINNLVERFERGGVGMVTCMNVRGELSDPTKVITMDATQKSGVEESESPDFSAFMISGETYKTVGEFDEGYFPAYFEDNDYHYRMKLANNKAICVPTALYYHFGSRTQNEALGHPIVPSGFFLKNMDYFTKKWGGTPANETFKVPFNNPNNDIKKTHQHEGI